MKIQGESRLSLWLSKEISLREAYPSVTLLGWINMVRDGPAHHGQTMAKDMELAGMGCCIDATPLIECLTGLLVPGLASAL